MLSFMSIGLHEHFSTEQVSSKNWSSCCRYTPVPSTDVIARGPSEFASYEEGISSTTNKRKGPGFKH